MSNRISNLMTSRNGKKLLVPFFTAGFPNKSTFISLVRTASDTGADMIEIGLPFSDPLSDGPEIQFSSHTVLDKNIFMRDILDMTEQLRKQISIPIIYMGYYNPIIAQGETAFLKNCRSAGCDGLIIPDLTVDEAGSYRIAAAKEELSTIFLAAPTTSDKRLKLIDSASTDFVYAVTVAGVTGTGKSFNTSTDRYLRHVRQQIRKPFVAGFGVSGPESAKRLLRYSDGIVIGSKLVRIIRDSKNNSQAVTAIGKFLGSVRKVLS